MSNPFEKGPGLPPNPEQPEDDDLEALESNIRYYEPLMKKVDGLLKEEGAPPAPREYWMLDPDDENKSLPEEWSNILAAARKGDWTEERDSAINSFTKYYDKMYQLQKTNPEWAEKLEVYNQRIDSFYVKTYGFEAVRPLDDDGSFDRNRDLNIVRIANREEFPGEYKILRPGLYDQERKVFISLPVVMAKPRYT